MFYAPSEIPLVTGDVLAHYRSALDSWGVTCVETRPETMPKRLLTVRDDGGPAGVTSAVLRLGVNVWADNKVDAAKLARDAVTASWGLRGVGSIKTVSDMTAPSEVDDEPQFTFQGNPLYHYFFTFRVVVKARTP